MNRRKLSNYHRALKASQKAAVDSIIINATLGWNLYVLIIKSMRSDSLPLDWGLPLVWSLSALAVLPLIAGILWYITLAARGQIWIKHVRSVLRPTSTWHRNQQLHYFGEDQTKIQTLAHS